MEITNNYPIRPEHINADRHMYGAFGKTETEISAGWIVRFCQWRAERFPQYCKQGGWEPFTRVEIDNFSGEDFYFNGLDEKFVVLFDGVYRITHEFVATCFLASPVGKE